MVYARRRRSRRFRRSKRFRRGAARRRLRPTLARARTTLLPDRFLVKLKYSEQFGMSSVAGTSGYYQFRVNSIFDPNLTGTGHQPLGHDQWANFYNRYRVRGMKYFVTFTNYNTTYQMEVAINLRPNSAVSSDMNVIREDPYTVFKTILGIEGSGQANKSSRGYASVAKIRGISRMRLGSESDLQAQFGNNPPITPILNLYLYNQDATAAGDCRCRVDLVYYTEMFDRKIQTAS